MEKRLQGASAKLRNLKELLSSTWSTNSGSQAGSSSSTTTEMSTSKKLVKRRTKNSISLFNLWDTTTVSGGGEAISTDNGSRPVSMHISGETSLRFGENGGAKSISMYGLGDNVELSTEIEPKSPNPSISRQKNPAARFFYTIRSKLRKRRRERSKILDSKSTDFSAFLSERKQNSTVSNSSSTSTRFHLKSSQSADNIDHLEAPIGYRNECDNNHRETPSGLMPSDDTYEEPVLDQSQTEPEPIRGSIVSTAPKTKCLTKELCDLLHYGWYWGGLSKEEAEEKLKGQPDGAFVVRDSSSDHYLLSLSFNSNGRTLHTRIEYRSGEFRFYSAEGSFPTVADLIEHCIAYSEAGVFCYSNARRADLPTFPVRLTKPISRFTEVKSLMYLCRFVIRKHIRVDLITHLPLPPSLIEFIKEQRYI